MGDAFLSTQPSTSTAAISALYALPPVDMRTLSVSAEASANSDAPTPAASEESSSGAGGNACRNTVCRYYLRGICRFGTLCRFSHDAIGGEVISCCSGGSASGIGSSSISEDDSDSPNTNSNGNGNSSNSNAVVASNSIINNPKEKIDELIRWANAPAFVPNSMKLIYTQSDIETAALRQVNVGFCEHQRQPTWAEVASVDLVPITVGIVRCPLPGSINAVCPYVGPCPYGFHCIYAVHLEQCKMCDQYCLHPTDLEQRRRHNQECLQRHERAMELSFAIARSRGKTCGICMEVIMEKNGNERRFGILPNCNHVFCLECIRKWRQATDFDHKVIKSCPECRVTSDFVCPSPFWVETKEQKDKLFSDYRAALGSKDCKYFRHGNGKCPFGNKCFYKHALANGELVDVGCPRRLRKVQRDNEDFIDLLDIYLWEFVDQRDFNFLESLLSTSDYSDDSEYTDDD